MKNGNDFPLRRWWHDLKAKYRVLIVLALLCTVPASGQLADRLARNPKAPDLAQLLAEAEAPTIRNDLTLCLDGPEFMAALARDLAGAQKSVVVQTLAFEADPAGLALARALIDSAAPVRRLLIDDYSRLVQNDKVVGAPNRLFDVDLVHEAEQTRTLITQLRAHGVDVRYGRPLGLDAAGRKARDHKKLVVVDDNLAYIGGINFSEHNFQWHDLMVRIATPGAAEFLAADFERSWRSEGVGQPTTAKFDGIALVCAAGDGDTAIEDAISTAIGKARHSLVLECPYITEPYLSLLGEARQRGVEVTIITSENINRACMKQSIMAACRRHGLQMRLLPGPMTHVKALLADGETLVLGSANFDFLSAALQPEILAVVRDPQLVAEFEQRVLAPDLVASRIWQPNETNIAVTDISAGLIDLAGDFLVALHGE